MKSTIRIVWLKNHGIRVVTKNDAGTSMRFVPHTGTVSVTEACAALNTYPVKMYRAIGSAGDRQGTPRLKSRKIQGDHRIPVAELWRAKRNPSILEDRRKRRDTAA
jgi:hypothetical protein